MSDDGKKVDAFSLEAGVPKIEGEIKPKPKYADRSSERIIALGLALVVLMVGIFFAALDAMDHKKKGHQEAVESEKKKPQPSKVVEAVVPKELTDAPDSDGSKGHTAPASLVGSTPKAQDDLLGGGSGASSLAGGAMVNPASTPAGLPSTVPSMGAARTKGQMSGGAFPGGAVDDGLGSGSSTAGNAPVAPAIQTPEEVAERNAKQDRLKRLSQARLNGLSAKNFAGDDKKSGPSTTPAGLLGSLPQQAGGMVPTSFEGQNGQKADSEQDEKMSFIKNSGKDDRNYLPYSPQPAVSKNELKRGSYLPLRLESNVNSGQPGMVLARVTEDIYDTVTGCRLLVPAMSVLQGAYDSKVAIGQTRNLVVWNYMRFEDGSDLTLGSMQGYDSTGAAGIEADVDNHYLRLFGATFGMSLITAGVQMSVPSTPTTGTTTQTPQQSIANALTQQYGQLGAQLIGKYLQIQPTLRNYAGERFMVMLPLTVVFKKVWRNRCVGGA